MKHKCIIGLHYDYEDTDNVTLSDLKNIEKENEERYNYLKKDNARYGLTDIIAKPYRLQDYLDRRKHLITHYTYCPICGKKIDWAKMKDEISQK